MGSNRWVPIFDAAATESLSRNYWCEIVFSYFSSQKCTLKWGITRVGGAEWRRRVYASTWWRKNIFWRRGCLPLKQSNSMTSCNPCCPSRAPRPGNEFRRSFCDPSILLLSTSSCTTRRTEIGTPPRLARRRAGSHHRELILHLQKFPCNVDPFLASFLMCDCIDHDAGNLHGKLILGAFWRGREVSCWGRRIVVPLKAYPNSSAGPLNTLRYGFLEGSGFGMH